MKLSLLFVMILFVWVGASFAQSDSYNGVTFSFKLTDGVSDESKTNFKVGDEIAIKTMIENCSAEMFPYVVTDNYYLYRFTLTKVGEILPVAYRSDKARILSVREETFGGGSVFSRDPIFPGNEQKLDTLKLSDRYENLAPGSYKLSIEYKTGKFIQANGTQKRLRLTSEVPFEIVP